LRIEDGQIVNGLSPHYGANPPVTALFNTDNTIVCMSSSSPESDTAEHSFPVVYRELFHADYNSSDCDFDYWYPGHTPSDVRFDGVYWAYKKLIYPDIAINQIPIPITNIGVRWIWQRDTVENGGFVPDSLRIGWIGVIWTEYSGYLDQPVLSAGEASYYPSTGNWVGCINYSERDINLNFRKRFLFIEKVPLTWNHKVCDSLGEIYHLPQTHHYPPHIPVSIIDKGYLSNVHLAARGSLNLKDWQRNHRIYNKILTSPPEEPKIRSSGQYFFRTSGNGEPIALQFHGFGDEDLSFGVSSIFVGEHEYPLQMKPMITPTDFTKPPDTLSTGWFMIDNIETMDVLTTGNAPERMSVWLECRSTENFWDVPLTAGEQMKINRQTVQLINGDNQEYRVRLCNNDYSPYHSETAISYDEETGYGKGTSRDYKTVDLGAGSTAQSVFIYPNPAREEINLTIKGTTPSEVLIISAVGGEAARLNVEGGKTVTVNTSTFPSGMYVVRVRRVGLTDAVVPFVVVR